MRRAGKEAKGHSIPLKIGVEGFEPPHGGTKNRCLTAWRHPKISINLNPPPKYFAMTGVGKIIFILLSFGHRPAARFIRHLAYGHSNAQSYCIPSKTLNHC